MNQWINEWINESNESMNESMNQCIHAWFFFGYRDWIQKAVYKDGSRQSFKIPVSNGDVSLCQFLFYTLFKRPVFQRTKSFCLGKNTLYNWIYLSVCLTVCLAIYEFFFLVDKKKCILCFSSFFKLAFNIEYRKISGPEDDLATRWSSYRNSSWLLTWLAVSKTNVWKTRPYTRLS